MCFLCFFVFGARVGAGVFVFEIMFFLCEIMFFLFEIMFFLFEIVFFLFDFVFVSPTEIL